MKRTFRYLFYPGLFLSAALVWQGMTDGFSIQALEKPLSSSTESKDPDFLPSLLGQKFTYLSMGKQAFVFESEDKRHVLKLFKPLSPYFRINLLKKSYKVTYEKLPFSREIFAFFHPEELRNAQEKTFQSYFNAFSLLSEETAVEYLHLASTAHLGNTLHLYDKLGRLHKLPSDTTCFLIQKKADLFYPTLEKKIKSKEFEEAKQLIDHFIDMHLSLIEKGIVDPSNFEGNIGCIDFKVLQIDVGRIFSKQDLDPSLSDKKASVDRAQIFQSTGHLKKWLLPRSLELYSHVEEREKNLKDHS
jgi:hypothetical protein